MGRWPAPATRPTLARRRTRRYRPSGHIDSYESLLLAGGPADLSGQLFKAFEDRLHHELRGRSGLLAAQLAPAS